MDVQAIATAFVLLHGSPPRSLMWRPGGMQKNSKAALEYCRKVDEVIQSQSPGIKIKRTVVWRNRVLRQIFQDCGIERKKS